MEFNVSADLVYNAEEAGTLVLNIRPIKVVKETLTIGPGTLNYMDYFFTVETHSGFIKQKAVPQL